MTIGGTVLFKKSNTKVIGQIIEEILSHKDTTITVLKANQTKLKTNKPTIEPTMSFIFKVRIPEELSRAYFMNLEDNTKSAGLDNKRTKSFNYKTFRKYK